MPKVKRENVAFVYTYDTKRGFIDVNSTAAQIKSSGTGKSGDAIRVKASRYDSGTDGDEDLASRCGAKSVLFRTEF